MKIVLNRDEILVAIEQYINSRFYTSLGLDKGNVLSWNKWRIEDADYTFEGVEQVVDEANPSDEVKQRAD